MNPSAWLARWAPIVVLVLALIVVWRLMAAIYSFQMRLCLAGVMLLLLLGGMLWWRYRNLRM